MECRGKKVLVAEDYVSNRNLLGSLLERAHYEVHLAGDGYEALERMFNGVFDAVILVDGQMPGFSDHEFAEFCRSAWPVTPVIFLSGDLIYVMGYTDEVDAAACLRGPFEAAMLLSVLRTVTQPDFTPKGSTVCRLRSPLNMDCDSMHGSQYAIGRLAGHRKSSPA